MSFGMSVDLISNRPASRKRPWWADVDGCIRDAEGYLVASTHEFSGGKKHEDFVVNAEFITRLANEEVPGGCGVCAGRMIFIRGRYPNTDKRLVCPTCCAERLDHIREVSDPDYGKTYQAANKQKGSG